MSIVKELIKPQMPDYYGNFLRENTPILIDKNRINLSILCGDERKILKTPINGDSTLVLRYKGEEGAVLSMETNNNGLNLVQLQGSRSRVSYQVSTGISWVNLFGDQIEKIATNPQSDFKLISMPPLEQISGLYESGTDSAVIRYKQLVNFLGLRFSKEDFKFLRILK